MIARLRGSVVTIEGNGVIIDVGGVGYRAFVPLSVLSSLPAEGQDTTSGGLIQQGKYAVEKMKGLKPGKYKVVITSGDPKEHAPPGELPGAPFPVAKERIPREYNTESKQEVEVKRGGPNKFDIDIP